jgi:hypothetical protein
MNRKEFKEFTFIDRYRSNPSGVSFHKAMKKKINNIIKEIESEDSILNQMAREIIEDK